MQVAYIFSLSMITIFKCSLQGIRPPFTPHTSDNTCPSTLEDALLILYCRLHQFQVSRPAEIRSENLQLFEALISSTFCSNHCLEVRLFILKTDRRCTRNLKWLTIETCSGTVSLPPFHRDFVARFVEVYMTTSR